MLRTAIGIDPGDRESALAIVEAGGATPRIIETATLPNDEFLRRLRGMCKYGKDAAGASGALNRYHRVAVEMIESYGMPVAATVFDTCLMVGRLLELMRGPEWRPVLITRKQVKVGLGLDVTADDADVRKALICLYGAPGTNKKPGPTHGVTGDAWAALAVATVCLTGNFRPYEAGKGAEKKHARMKA